MKGFKEFLLRGNLIDLAVAFIMATAFGAVVTAFTELVMFIIALVIGGEPNLDAIAIGPLPVGPFLTALVNFVLIAAVVYFGIVKPYRSFKDRFDKTEPEEEAEDQTKLLGEIRDLLAGR